MKEKAKHSISRMNSLVFILLWLAGHAGAWVAAVVSAIIISRIPGLILDNMVPLPLTALGTGAMMGLVQKTLVERGLGKSMRGWVPFSLAGGLLSGLVTNFTLFNLMGALGLWDSDFFMRLLLVPLFVPAAVVQWLWLRRRVRHAWLWIVTAIVGAILFILPLLPPFYLTIINFLGIGDGTTVLTVALSALLYSGATGATMQYLWTQEREKSKNEAAFAQQSDEAERLDRLAAADSEEYVPESASSTISAKTNLS